MGMQWTFFQSWREPDDEGALREYGVPYLFRDLETATRAWRAAAVGRLWVKPQMVGAEISDLLEWEVSEEDGLRRARLLRVVAPSDREYVTMPAEVKGQLREAFLSVGQEVPS